MQGIFTLPYLSTDSEQWSFSNYIESIQEGNGDENNDIKQNDLEKDVLKERRKNRQRNMKRQRKPEQFLLDNYNKHSQNYSKRVRNRKTYTYLDIEDEILCEIIKQMDLHFLVIIL